MVKLWGFIWVRCLGPEVGLCAVYVDSVAMIPISILNVVNNCAKRQLELLMLTTCPKTFSDYFGYRFLLPWFSPAAMRSYCS